jgi:hypothetical protein
MIIGVAVIYDEPIVQIIAICFFLICCQCGPLPTGFMYVAEVANYKAVSVGTTLVWVVVLLTGLFVRPVIENQTIGKYVFIMFGAGNIISTVIIYLFLKETKGLSEAEVSKLYYKEEIEKPIEL